MNADKLFKNKIEISFYRSDLGNEPVRDWLKMQSKEDKKILGEEVDYA